MIGRHEWKPMQWLVNQRTYNVLCELTQNLIDTGIQYQCEMHIVHPDITWYFENIFVVDDNVNDENYEYTGCITVHYDFANKY